MIPTHFLSRNFFCHNLFYQYRSGDIVIPEFDDRYKTVVKKATSYLYMFR